MEDEEGGIVSARLERLAADLAETLGDAAEVVRNDVEVRGCWAVRITPRRRDAVPVAWLELGDEVILEVGTDGGGRWELNRTAQDIDFLESIVRAVIAGQVREVSAGGRRSRVSVVMRDGTVQTSTRVGCLPMPLWPRWGRAKHYSPYNS